MPTFQPIRLSRRSKPFDSSDWIFEIKHDGFRALACVEAGASNWRGDKRRDLQDANRAPKSRHDLCVFSYFVFRETSERF
jgi:hypothetical protein